MKRWSGKPTIAATAALALLAGREVSLASGAAADEQPEIVIVTHTSVPLESVRKSDLAQVFLGLRTSLGGVNVTPINVPPTEARQSFLKRLTGMSANRIEEHYIALVLRGEGRRPLTVDGPTDVPRLAFEAKRIVAWLPRAQYDALTETQKSLLKILTVDGRAPGESDYWFRRR